MSSASPEDDAPTTNGNHHACAGGKNLRNWIAELELAVQGVERHQGAVALLVEH